MRKKFITNLALVVFLNLLVKPFWIFGIDRTIQNVVGAGEYGFYFSLFNFSILLNILLDAGITNFNNRSIARDPGRLSEYFPTIVGLKFLLALFYAIVCFGAAGLLGYTQEQLQMLLFLVLNQFLASFILYLRSNLSGLHYFRTDGLLSVLDRSLLIAFCGILLWTDLTDQPFRIMWLVYAQTASYGITGVVALLLVMRHIAYFRPGINISRFAEILRQSYPFALLILLMTFYNRIDSVMLERLLPEGKIQAGIYAQSFRILDAAAMFAFLFAGLLLPVFSRMLKNGEPVGEMVRLSSILILIPAITLSAIGLFYSQDVIGWMYNEHIQASSRIFPLLMFGFVAISVTYIFGTLLTANKNLRELNILALSAVVLNIVLNLLFIPRRQALGAAIASLVTQGYMASVQILISIARIKLNIDLKIILRLGIFGLMVFAVGLLTRNYISSWYTGCSTLILGAILLSFMTGLLKAGDLYRIVRFGEK